MTCSLHQMPQRTAVGKSLALFEAAVIGKDYEAEKGNPFIDGMWMRASPVKREAETFQLPDDRVAPLNQFLFVIAK